MASSDVQICNAALALIKAKPIVTPTLDSTTEESRLCMAVYPIIRDSVLRMHDWNFAIKRVQLPQLSTPPVFGYNFAYTLPQDCIRVLKAFTNNAPLLPAVMTDYKIETNHTLVTNSALVFIKYVADITDSTQFDTYFVLALTYQLASYIGYVLTNDAALQTQYNNMAMQTVKLAKQLNSQEGTPDEIWPKNAWTNFRAGWRRGGGYGGDNGPGGTIGFIF